MQKVICLSGSKEVAFNFYHILLNSLVFCVVGFCMHHGACMEVRGQRQEAVPPSTI